MNMLINVFAILILTAYLSYIWKNSKMTDMLKYYAVMHLFTIFVLVGGFLTDIAPEGKIKWIVIVAANIVKTFFDISFLCYGYYFKTRHSVGRKIILLLTYPVLYLLIMLTNPYHHLFIKEALADKVNYGILYYILLAVGYGFQFAGAIYIIVFLIGKKKPSLYRIFIMLITLMAFTLQFLFVSNIFHSPIDINPILILLIFTFLFFGAYRMGLLNTLSIGVIRSLKMYNDAILVLDEKGAEVYRNHVCSVMGEETINFIAAQFADTVGKSQELSSSSELKTVYKGKTFTASVRPVKTIWKKTIGYVCIIHDDTEFLDLINDLKEKNEQLVLMNESIRGLAAEIRRLAVIEERNVLAKEIHDVLGHSLNLAFHILESNKTIIDKQPEKAIQRLKKVLEDIDKGLGEVKAVPSAGAVRQQCQERTLYADISNMADRLREAGISVELAISEDIRGCDNRVIQTIYRICQEASTNSIKHGKATQVVMSIKRKESTILVHIVDNGKGCASFSKGNGLKGMEERVKEIGGSISFGPFDDNKGFLVHAVLPVGQRIPDRYDTASPLFSS